MSALTTRERLAALLKLHEGVRRYPYRCTAGKLTIGVGRNLDDNGLRPAEIECLLRHDIEDVIEEVHEHWPWVEHLADARKVALYDMAFQHGLGGFSRYAPTLALIREGRYPEAARRLEATRWATQAPLRARRLISMIKTGAWPDDVPV